MRINRDDTWRRDAACKTQPRELFFPDGERGVNAIQADMAKQVCFRCPVMFECLKAALDGNEFGVWGGTTEKERRDLKNKTTVSQYATVDMLRDLLLTELPACERCGKHRKEKADGMCATCVTETGRENAYAKAS